jgi:inorganic triphosphatase YgiF
VFILPVPANLEPAISHETNQLHIEKEIKFSLDADYSQKILSSRRVRRSTKQEQPGKRYLSTYYDTRQHSLRKSGVTLRVREVDGNFEQTIKIPLEGSIGMLNSEEWTVPISTRRPDLSLFDASVVASFNPRKRKINLLPMFTTDIDRTVMLLEYKRSRFELALDRGHIVSHRKSARSMEICELELELERGNPVAMLDFALALNEECGLSPEHRTKAQRGYALLRSSLRPKATKAVKVLLDPQMSSGEAFHLIISNALRQLYQNELPTLEGVPEGIHQARVSIRRIRAALRAFKKALPYDKRKAFNGEFRWFQLRLARARDWHVFVSETLPRIQASRPHARVDLERLYKLGAAERRRATRDAKALFTSKRYTRLLLQFQRWLMTLDKGNQELDTNVCEFARAVLRKSRRDFLIDVRPLSRMTMDELHDLRKRGKKARYATEFFAGLWSEDGVQSSVKAMAKIQDLLGKANDASVARQVLASVPPRALKSSAIALVQSWSDERSRQCIQSGQSIWRKFHKTAPLWLNK